MQIKVEVNGLDSIKASIDGLRRQLPFATARALTNTAHAIRNKTVDEMRSKLDRPTSYTTKQAMQVKMATKHDLRAVVGLGVKFDSPSKGSDYIKTLGHLFSGGSRSFKKMEGAFRKLGVLKPGAIMVPGSACPLDSYGNPPRALIVQLISYFRAFGEQGYRANMTDKRRAKIAGEGRTDGGYKRINGAVYFISTGKREIIGRRSWSGGRWQHLPAGIWKKSGIHGQVVEPVFIFAKLGVWKRYIDLPNIAQTTVARVWQSEFNDAIAFAKRTAR